MQQDNNRPSKREVYLVQQPVPRREIDLVDLWKVLVRRKVLVAAVFIVTLLFGIIVATTRPVQFSYSATIRVGKIAPLPAGDKAFRLIESPAAVIARLREVYIPQSIAKVTQADPSLDGLFTIVARWPPKSDILVLEATGPKSLEAAYLEMIGEVIELVSDDHDRITRAAHASQKAKREELSQAIASLADQTKLLRAQSDRLDQLDAMNRTSVAEIRNLITDLVQRSHQADSQQEGESAKIAALLLDNEIRRYQDDLRVLEQRMAIQTPNERDHLNRELREIRRQTKVNRSALKRLEAETGTLSETRALAMPTRSSHPVGVNPFLIVAIFFGLGLVLAAVIAFIVEALQVRRQQSES